MFKGRVRDQTGQDGKLDKNKTNSQRQKWLQVTGLGLKHLKKRTIFVHVSLVML